MAPIEWFEDRPVLLATLFTFSILCFAGSLLAIPWIVPRMPADLFVRRPALQPAWLRRSRSCLILWRVAKNLVGIGLVLAGLAMLVLPGQGILTILMGLFLIEGPGRRRLILAVVRRPRIFDALNWIRQRKGREPFESPAPP